MPTESLVNPALCAFIHKDAYIRQDNFVGCCVWMAVCYILRRVVGSIVILILLHFGFFPTFFLPFYFISSVSFFCTVLSPILHPSCSASHFWFFSAAWFKNIITLSNYGHLWCSAKIKHTR